LRVWIPIFWIVTSGCEKIPLRADAGNISGQIHWFENEQTSYLFFQVQEIPDRLLDPRYSLVVTESTATGGTEERTFSPINFDEGVHEHSVAPCPFGSACGSFSFRSDRQIASAVLRFQYDRESEIDITRDLAVFNHNAGNSANSFSALHYGIFDESNRYLAIETVHNFGTPQDRDVVHYGMKRRFRISNARLVNPDNDDLEQATAAAFSETIFPASVCSSGEGTRPVIIEGRRYWLPDTFDTTDSNRGVCFDSQFLDKQGEPLAEASASGLGRRNPELQFGDLKLRTPLRQTLEVYIQLRVCDGETYTSSLVNQNFLEYQQFILGMPDRSTDVCFRVGEEAAFESALSRHLAERLDEAKQNNPDGKDIVFVVGLHEAFSREFKKVQSVVAGQLTAIVNTERQSVTPRLVGAMVYAGSVHFTPTVLQTRYVLWCPQEINENNLIGAATLFNQNCTTLRPQELDLRVINFVTPLGPFPSLEQYTKYIKDFGDRGLARNPDLKFFSVPTGANTIQQSDEQTTFFDSERYTIPAGEYARFCYERNLAAAALFKVRYDTMPETSANLSVFELNNIWLSDDKPTEYRVGLTWTYPFVGRVDYTTALVGSAVGMVPFSRSQRTYENLADARWFAESFDFGSAVQHCTRYCDNPYFDEGGIYQIAQPWRQESLANCPNPKIPVWNGGGAE
jgi:hypothetical protein